MILLILEVVDPARVELASKEGRGSSHLQVCSGFSKRTKISAIKPSHSRKWESSIFCYQWC